MQIFFLFWNGNPKPPPCLPPSLDGMETWSTIKNSRMSIHKWLVMSGTEWQLKMNYGWIISVCFHRPSASLSSKWLANEGFCKLPRCCFPLQTNLHFNSGLNMIKMWWIPTLFTYCIKGRSFQLRRTLWMSTTITIQISHP